MAYDQGYRTENTPYPLQIPEPQQYYSPVTSPGPQSRAIFGFSPPSPAPSPVPYYTGYQPIHPAPVPQTYLYDQKAGAQYQYSQCTGKRKALVIGINYFNSPNQLRGCINDAQKISRFLNQQFRFAYDDMVILTDDQANPASQPTRANIIRAMRWLVNGASPNDSLFFHFSGHGGQTEDLDGDEEDGYDETIYPVDFRSAGMIVDDEMHDIMVKPLPAGCRLTAIFDCCHSGSALDLPYEYGVNGTLREPNMVRDAGHGLLDAGMSYARGDVRGIISAGTSLVKMLSRTKEDRERTRIAKTSPADVIQLSGCKDYQTSSDTTEAGQATGAMSWAFIEVLSRQPQQTYHSLLVNIRDMLAAKYEQKPVLSASHPIDTRLSFTV
jgi:hypothetical protein